MRVILNLILFSFFLTSCQQGPEKTHLERPNILWLSAEDLSPRFAAYGDSTVDTPNIDRLSREGITYNHAYTTAGVCSPSRNAIITGRYQTSNGGHNMRNMVNTFPEKTGLPMSYSSVPPAEVKMFPEYLRAAGYYTTNNVKTDYQFIAPPTVWDETSGDADWAKRKDGQPFFATINFFVTHESRIWANADHEMRVDPAIVPLPPYYPDNEISRTDVARHYSNISELDDQIGEVLDRLEASGELENTIIFFWGDHGDGLPFYKREVYRRGLLIPLVVRFPDKKEAGTYNNDFISAIDFGPTVLSLAGLATPNQMHGKAFLGQFDTSERQEYIFGARDRIDSEYDRVRSVMDRKLQYIRNYKPELPLYMDIAYRKQIPTMRNLLELKEKNELTAEQAFWFQETKPKEELYDWVKDPFQLTNLADKPEYTDDIARLSKAMDKWIADTKDLGAIPEKELLKQMWNGGNEAPVTNAVTVMISNGILDLDCETAGASIGYRQKGSETWEVYTESVKLSIGDYEAIAMRIGYEPSEINTFSVE